MCAAQRGWRNVAKIANERILEFALDVKEAVRTAKDYLAELYIDEEVVNVGLEEVRYDYDTDKWHITIGFSRPWDRRLPMSVKSSSAGLVERSYKEICIDDDDGRIEWLKARILGPPQIV